MKTSNSNVIVYVKQPARREQVRVISKAIGALDGVVKAQNSSRADNMICVDYDPRVIESQHILRCVNKQSCSIQHRH